MNARFACFFCDVTRCDLLSSVVATDYWGLSKLPGSNLALPGWAIPSHRQNARHERSEGPDVVEGELECHPKASSRAD